MQCSMARSLEVIGDWWTPLIIRDLYYGIDRFDDLIEDLGISRNLLAGRLAHLIEHGIVERRRYADHPPRDNYVLTESGQAFIPVLMAIAAWGDRWATPDGGPPLVFKHRQCGHRFTPAITCDACGKPVEPEEVDTMPGPGGRPGPGTRVLAAVLSGRRPRGIRT